MYGEDNSWQVEKRERIKRFSLFIFKSNQNIRVYSSLHWSDVSMKGGFDF